MLLVALAWGWWQQAPMQAPDVTFTTIDGKRIPLRSLRGRVVLVNFWATTCALCLKEIPMLAGLHAAMRDQGLSIIGVAMPYDRPDRVLELVRRRDIPYPVALDIDGSVTAAFKDVRGTPTTFLVAPDGRLVSRRLGPLHEALLRRNVADLLRDGGA